MCIISVLLYICIYMIVYMFDYFSIQLRLFNILYIYTGISKVKTDTSIVAQVFYIRKRMLNLFMLHTTYKYIYTYIHNKVNI